MQTFVPDVTFELSVGVLDNKRLGKQRVETLQIFRALTVPTYGWKNHPAVLMWKGYEGALVAYGIECCVQWIDRGFQDGMLPVFMSLVVPDGASFEYPKWWGDWRMHQSHQSNLLRKDPSWYRQFNWKVPDDLPYFWPTKEGY